MGAGNAMRPIPESRATLHEQQKQLLSGHRRVQMFPRGHTELPKPRGMYRLKLGGDVFHYNPKKITPKEIIKAHKAGRENDILDLGPVSKHEAVSRAMKGEHPVAVVERTPKGVEARAAGGTVNTAPSQIAAMESAKSPGNTVGVESPDNVIAQRFADGGMSDLPDAPWAIQSQSDASSLPDAPWVTSDQSAAPLTLGESADEPADHGLSERQKLSPLGKAISPITSYPETYSRMNREAREQVAHGVSQIAHPDSAWDVAKGVGNTVAGGLGYVASPISAAYRSVVGQPIEDVTGIPREYTEFAAELATPGIGLPRLGGVPASKVPPLRPEPNGPLGVTLTEGQATGNLPAIRTEQSARRGMLGSQAAERAKQFSEQQAEEIAAARGNVTRGLDTLGNQELASSPLEAARDAAETVKREAARAKAGVTTAYDVAKAQPGEIHSSVFQGIGNRIKNVLSQGDDPVIIDDETTPVASRALQDIEDNISRLQIQNKAALNTPAAEDIVGVNLRGVDQTRKRLVRFRQDAYGTGNATDGRATQAVIDAFDGLVDHAVNNGAFNGDPSAINAWNAARAAHSDYMSTFGKQSKDPVGRVMEKILGSRNNPAATPEAVADYLYGSSGVNPSDLNVNVANRFKKILGEQSPEWAAVKQGLFKKLTETGEGVTDFGPGQIAQRLNKFLNVDGGSQAAVVFTPAEKDLLQQFADLHRRLEIPKTGAPWSETPTFMSPIVKNILTGITTSVGALIGHAVAPGMFGEVAGAAIGASSRLAADAAQARKVAKQMPMVAENIKRWQRAVDANTKANTNTSRIALSRATANLSVALTRAGVNPNRILSPLQAIQGTVPAVGDQQQQKQGGRIKRRAFDDGGDVGGGDAGSFAGMGDVGSFAGTGDVAGGGDVGSFAGTGDVGGGDLGGDVGPGPGSFAGGADPAASGLDATAATGETGVGGIGADPSSGSGSAAGIAGGFAMPGFAFDPGGVQSYGGGLLADTGTAAPAPSPDPGLGPMGGWGDSQAGLTTGAFAPYAGPTFGGDFGSLGSNSSLASGLAALDAGGIGLSVPAGYSALMTESIAPGLVSVDNIAQPGENFSGLSVPGEDIGGQGVANTNPTTGGVTQGEYAAALAALSAGLQGQNSSVAANPTTGGVTQGEYAAALAALAAGLQGTNPAVASTNPGTGNSSVANTNPSTGDVTQGEYGAALAALAAGLNAQNANASPNVATGSPNVAGVGTGTSPYAGGSNPAVADATPSGERASIAQAVQAIDNPGQTVPDVSGFTGNTSNAALSDAAAALTALGAGPETVGPQQFAQMVSLLAQMAYANVPSYNAPPASGSAKQGGRIIKNHGLAGLIAAGTGHFALPADRGKS